MAKNISYMPTEGISYDPTEEKYWDADALQGEITRVFEVCHGCRMCFKFCDSCPNLFDAIDNKHDGDVRNDASRAFGTCMQRWNKGTCTTVKEASSKRTSTIRNSTR